jgi:hypothetical protein
MFRWLLIFSILLCLSCKDDATWPAINKETKPWTRWWWHGSALTKEGITAELEAYAKAGLGGVEITPIYGVKGFEDKFIPYLSDRWMELLTHTLKEADRLNMGVDMATGTGWPFGGPWVTDEFASRNVEHRVYELKAGATLKDKVDFIQQPLLRTVLPANLTVKDLTQPVTTNNLQQLAIDQVKFERSIPLVTLMGYSDSGETIDLTDRVGQNGLLKWTPSAGNWKLYALFQGWHGKMVERAGPGGEGSVIDHFSREALDHYLSKFDSAFSKHNIKSLRAFFNDSYEVDDASGAADWTPRLFEEFQKQRGYDLKHHLPALFDSLDHDNPGVLYDYRLTISELVLGNFTTPWTKWASNKNKITRNQAHGSPANILDLYSVVDIPEIEGTDRLRIKMASSAGNLSHKRLISSESATWLDEHFRSDLGDIKNAVDLFLLNGVNHIFYHGTSYSPPGEPWPGWLFYAAVHLNPRNPQWNDFHALNEYVARCQSFLQNSTADNDILLYYPVADPMSRPGAEMIEHFDGIGKQFAGSEFERVANDLLSAGFDFISDKQILQLSTGNKKTIVVPACNFIPKETLDHLNKLAEEGVNVVMTGKPRHLAGFNDKDKQVTISEAIGSTLKPGEDPLAASGLTFTRRRMNGHLIYFIKNERDDFDERVSISPRSVLLFDPMSGVIGEPEHSGNGIRLQLAKGQTIIVAESDKTAPPFPYIDLAGEPILLDTEWEVIFESGGPALPPSFKTTELGSWTDRHYYNWTSFTSDYADFSGTALYKTHFPLPGKPDNNGWILDLGDVRESVRVVLNGRDVCTLVAHPFRVKIEPSMAQGDNVLELHVSNLAANRISYLDRNGVPWKKFYNINFPARYGANRKDGLFSATAWSPEPSGLLGPVRLLPVGIPDK